MCALKLMPKSGNTSTREKRVGENWIEELCDIRLTHTVPLLVDTTFPTTSSQVCSIVFYCAQFKSPSTVHALGVFSPLALDSACGLLDWLPSHGPRLQAGGLLPSYRVDPWLFERQPRLSGKNRRELWLLGYEAVFRHVRFGCSLLAWSSSPFGGRETLSRR